jgi:hypothetical protein
MFGGTTTILPKAADLGAFLELLRDPEKVREAVSKLAADAERNEKAVTAIRREQRAREHEFAERERELAERAAELQRAQTAWTGEEARRRAAVEALEQAAAEKDARSEALLAQRTRDAEAAAKSRKELQAAVDKIAA